MELVQQTNVEANIAHRQMLVLEKKQIEKEIDAMTAAIKDSMVDQGIDTLEAGEHVATLTVRERATLDKTELISLGVTTEQIKKATKVSTYVQLDVREKKG